MGNVSALWRLKGKPQLTAGSYTYHTISSGLDMFIHFKTGLEFTSKLRQIGFWKVYEDLLDLARIESLKLYFQRFIMNNEHIWISQF